MHDLINSCKIHVNSVDKEKNEKKRNTVHEIKDILLYICTQQASYMNVS